MSGTISVVYMSSNDRRAKPTAADLAAAAHLRRIWDAMTTGRPTQEDMAEALKVNQSAVSQYRNGKIPLNYRAVLIFASKLRCKPEDIRTDLPEMQMGVRMGGYQISETRHVIHTAKGGWPFKIDRERYDRLKPRDRAYIEKMLEQAISHCEERADLRPKKRAG